MLKLLKLKIITYSILAGLVTLSSCTKVIDISLNDAAPKFVIQGDLSNVTATTTVTVSKTINFSQDNVFPSVSGALVTIKDNSSGLISTLNETSLGTYQAFNLQGIIGHTYSLHVSINGANYSSTSIMPDQVPLDSITFQHNEGFGRNVISPMPNLQDPANVNNYYQFEELVNGRHINRIFVFDDRLSNGKYIARQLFNDSSYIALGDMVELEMKCINKNVFEYFKQLSGLDPTNGQPTSPANPINNIVGGCLGYFSTYTSQKMRAIAK
jgi:hypothetical protein